MPPAPVVPESATSDAIIRAMAEFRWALGEVTFSGPVTEVVMKASRCRDRSTGVWLPASKRTPVIRSSDATPPRSGKTEVQQGRPDAVDVGPHRILAVRRGVEDRDIAARGQKQRRPAGTDHGRLGVSRHVRTIRVDGGRRRSGRHQGSGIGLS